MLRFACKNRFAVRRFSNQIRPVDSSVPGRVSSVGVSPGGESASTRRTTARRGFEFTMAQAGVVIGCCAAILGMVKLTDLAVERRKRGNQLAIVSEEVIGKPKLGGPWTLYNSANGQAFTSEQLRGKYQLIYFGFTYCPDICPEELEKQAQVLTELDKDPETRGMVVPVFITVDPHRDTLAQTQMYVKEFHPSMIGLTGTPEQVKRVSRLFRVYYNQGIRTANDQGEEDYLVDHSIIHYFMGPNNEFVDFFGKNLNAMEIVDKIKTLIAKKKNSPKQLVTDL